MERKALSLGILVFSVAAITTQICNSNPQLTILLLWLALTCANLIVLNSK